MGRVFNLRSGCMHTMHLLPSVALQPNLELKTWPKQLLGSLPLVITLHGQCLSLASCLYARLTFLNSVAAAYHKVRH
jgi:hypothetical protein